MPHTLLYIRCLLLTAATLLLAAATAAAQLPNGAGSLQSPDGKTTLKISVTNDTSMTFAISRGGKTYIDTAQVFLSYGDNRNALNPTKIVGTKWNHKLDTLRSKIWERAVQPAIYNELLVKFQEGQRTLLLHLRLYNQGFATGIDISDPQKNTPNDYHTTYHWVNKGIFHLMDTKTENGYNSVMGKDMATAISPTLTMSTTDTLLALTHEAANYEFFSRAKIILNNFSVTIGQGGLYQIANYSTPWHYVVFADNAADFMEGKYIDRSLCMKPTERYDWVKPGKVYRHIGNRDSDFATDLVKRSIDFAAQMKFQYVLLDNGWYGLGYDAEFDPDSDPMRTVAPLNLPEAIQYAKGKGIGILLYFNKSVFLQSSADSVLTYYSKLGIKGIKTGFIKNRSQQDNVLASHVITKCASLRLVVNVHDEYRPTGVEMLYPNFLTSEGLRGNEHLDNTGNHTTTLPFVRYMIGAGDYTICYEPADTTRLNLQTTKAHQMALSVVLFSPLQHIFWYGSPDWYTNNLETEFFKSVPTVWDDYKVIGGFPRRYIAIARRKGNTWYLATISGLLKTDISFPLSKITKRHSKITVYEDGDTLGTIKKSSFNASPDFMVNISIRPNSGYVMVIEPTGK